MVSLCCIALNATLSAQTNRSHAPVSKASDAKCETKFHTLSRYKGNRWSSVFTDREVAPALKALLKKDYGLLRDSLQEVNYPDSLSFVDKQGVLTLEGGVKGLYTIMEAALIIEPCGNIYAAILDDGKRFLYFTNDQTFIGTLPPATEKWRADVESRRSQPTEVSKLPVVFKSK